jgi:tetratricopeptide (TPR) repeat protein
MLRQASESGAGDPYYRYVYGVALHSSGERAAALEVLRGTHERFPGHAPTLVALATMSRDEGDLERARDYAQRLLELSPADPTARALLAELAGPGRR